MKQSNAVAIAVVVFAAVCASFFFQPFTGWFLLVAFVAVVMAVGTYAVLRPRRLA